MTELGAGGWGLGAGGAGGEFLIRLEKFGARQTDTATPIASSRGTREGAHSLTFRKIQNL